MYVCEHVHVPSSSSFAAWPRGNLSHCSWVGMCQRRSWAQASRTVWKVSPVSPSVVLIQRASGLAPVKTERRLRGSERRPFHSPGKCR